MEGEEGTEKETGERIIRGNCKGLRGSRAIELHHLFALYKIQECCCVVSCFKIKAQ